MAAVLLLCAACLAAAEVAEYELKAEFLERFTRFIDWPYQALSDEDSPFVIGVVGANPFGPYLQELAATRRIKGRRVIVREFSARETIGRCHVLFIASSERSDLASVLDRLGNRPVLTVADTAGYARAGVMINFYSSEGRIRFEINQAAAERTGLRVKAKLLKLARIVDAGGER